MVVVAAAVASYSRVVVGADHVVDEIGTDYDDVDDDDWGCVAGDGGDVVVGDAGGGYYCCCYCYYYYYCWSYYYRGYDSVDGH